MDLKRLQNKNCLGVLETCTSNTSATGKVLLLLEKKKNRGRKMINSNNLLNTLPVNQE